MISFTAFHLALKTCSKSCRTIRLTVSWGFLFLFVLEDVSGQINRTSPSLTFRINSGSAIGGGGVLPEASISVIVDPSSGPYSDSVSAATSTEWTGLPPASSASLLESPLQAAACANAGFVFNQLHTQATCQVAHTHAPPPHFPTFFYAQIGAERGRLEWR